MAGFERSTSAATVDGAVRRLRRAAGVVFDRVVRSIDRIFDYRHRTDTSGIIPVNELNVSGANIRHATRYEPTPANVFRRAIESLPIDHRQFVFIDCGSGKGRVLLLASHYPFSQIIGVEFSERLYRVATNNVAKYRSRKKRCFDIRVICADAAQYEFPRANLVLFLWNPFDETVLAQVLHNLEKVAAHKDVYLIYCEADHSSAVDAMDTFPYKKQIALPRVVMRRPGACSPLFIYSNAAF
jgi:16S rRNA G966 N2-methylase RsmD